MYVPMDCIQEFSLPLTPASQIHEQPMGIEPVMEQPMSNESVMV